MKIGTLSINIHTFYFNYGAILHSWAFQTLLNKSETLRDNEIIDYVTPKIEKWDVNEPIKNFVNGTKTGRKFLLRYLLLHRFYKIRKNKIESFIKNHMKISNESYNQQKLEKAKLDYDVLICESDVIWSSGYFDKAFFLAFDNMKKSKRISYSPSLSDCKFTENQLKLLKEYIDSIDYISVRETYAKDFLHNFTKKEIMHVLDPVFLLEPYEYEVITSPKLLEYDYLLLYLPADNNKYLRQCAYEYARKYKLKIIEVSTRLELSLHHKVIITAGVEDFLSLIKNATMVFTNSFHAVSFSIIFNKQFYAGSRQCAGKVNDVLNFFNLSNRLILQDNFKELPIINYDIINEQLLEKKKDCISWLYNSIEGEKK